tara:strand:+ start:524 stop:1501 length:978 start_codon:yes stop_codon:yes gene_type:complete
MKIVIVTVPLGHSHGGLPPFGALAVIQSLRTAGYAPYLYDLDALRLSEDKIKDFFLRYRPDVIGISAVVSTSYAFIKKLCLWLKKELPGTRIIVGGSMTASAEILLRFSKVDVCVHSEGEYTVRELLHYYEKNIDEDNQEELKKIKGILYLDKRNNLVNSGFRSQLQVDEISDPDYTILEKYSNINLFIKEPTPEYFSHDRRSNELIQKGKKEGFVMASKGCVARCSFCHRSYKGYRQLPPERIIGRIKYLMDRYDVGFVVFSDECFGADKKRTSLHGSIKKIKYLMACWRSSLQFRVKKNSLGMERFRLCSSSVWHGIRQRQDS